MKYVRYVCLAVLSCVILSAMLWAQPPGKEPPSQTGDNPPPESEMTYRFPPIPVNPKIFSMDLPWFSELARKIESGTASMPERRAFYYLNKRLAPYDRPIPPRWRLNAQKTANRLKAPALNSALQSEGLPPVPLAYYSWTPLGPSAYYDGSDVNSGRATALWVDPSNKNHIIMGTADGGVWETTNQGSAWTSIFDTAASLSIGCLAVDPNNSSVMYVGTGEGNFNGDAVGGVGMYKSTDGGATWTLLSLPAWTYSGYYHNIRRIVVDPKNSSRVYAAADGGVLISTDGGGSWTSTTCDASGSPYIFTDLAVDPVNSSSGSYSIIYAAIGFPSSSATVNGIYRSKDGGSTWTDISTAATSFPTTNVGRITLVMSPSAIEYTSDATATSVAWTSKSSTNFCNQQAFYDMTGVVDPANPAHLIVGGLDVYMSTNNGGSISQESSWYSSGSIYSHADHHHMVMPDSTTLYDANDGGFFIGTVNWSSKSISWTNKNTGLDTLQFYSLAQHPTDPSKYQGGLQDNGQAYFNGSTWNQVYGGDGGMSAWDQQNASYAYEEYVYAQIYRNSNMTGHPTSWNCIRSFGGCSCSTCVPDSATAFIAPFTLDANNQNVMYACSNRVYKDSNVRSSSSWSAISSNLTSGGTNYITAIHSAKNNGTSGTLYVGTVDGKVQVTTNGGTNWTDVTPASGLGAVTAFATDPTNGQHVLVTISGFGSHHVYRSTNGGSSWTDITGSLPAIPFNTIVLNPGNPNEAYAGADFGVYVNENVWSGDTWVNAMGSMPAVAINQLEFNPTTGNLRAATHGRGIWELTSTLSNPKEASPALDMKATAGSGTSIAVTYTPGCGAQNTVVYTGDLSTLQSSGISWTNGYCSLGNTGSLNFDPGSNVIYFVVVSYNSNNAEGSYGTDSQGAERPAVAASPCGLTQNLAGTCP
ncbi:MAG: hypothetical protein P8Z49_12505 [Acidobacteriota bacterium]